METPWLREAADVSAAVGADAVRGLTGQEAAARLATYGENVLVAEARVAPWRKFLRQFADPPCTCCWAPLSCRSLRGCWIATKRRRMTRS